MKFKHLLISSRSIINTSKSRGYSSLTSCPNILNRSRNPNSSRTLISINPNFIIINPRNLQTLVDETTSINSNLLQNQEPESEEDEAMTEFLSRFVWVMRGKLNDVYPTSDKPTINAMLLVIVEKVVEELERGNIEEMIDRVGKSGLTSLEFSEDLWKTVWEVSHKVLEDMKKERKKQEMKKYTQCEEVKEMCRFASEVGVRGNMLREFRFKWAKEKMEEDEFYQNLERMRDEDHARQREEEAIANGMIEGEIVSEEVVGKDDGAGGEAQLQRKVVSLPQRRGKIKYKIYGLDLSDPKWAEIANTIHESEKLYVPEEPKKITGKCKLVTEQILNLTEGDDVLTPLAEWMELLGPSRVDWFALLDKLQERNTGLYSKVSELLLDEDSFQANIRDYSKLINAYSKDNRIPDAERILEKMTTKGIQPDILTYTILVHMYSKAGKLDRAKESFEQLKTQRFEPDLQTYTSMIMAYVNAGDPKFAETLMREMESRDIKPTKDIYMALLSSFSEMGHVDCTHRISTTMQFAGLQPSVEWSTLLVEAYVNAGDYEKARKNFDDMQKYGLKPDDRCAASLLRICYKKNFLDKALDLMLKLEKDGFKPGIQMDTIWLDWFVKLGLIDEAEEVYKRLKETGETNSIGIQVSLCSMYLVTKDEKKALQTLGILEGKKEELGREDFERIVNGLMACGLMQEAWKFNEMMEARGFYSSEAVRMSLKMAQVSQTMRGRGKRPSMPRN
ncbi:hypothetical protein ACHQM5_021866 [Ranunculus cassubicifolius]